MNVISKVTALVFTLLISSLAFAADEVDVSKLPDSTLAGTQITELLTGKKLSGKTTKGDDATFEFGKDGYVFVNSSRGQDTGKWTVENDQICAKFRRAEDACPTVVTVVSGKIHLGDLFIQK